MLVGLETARKLLFHPPGSLVIDSGLMGEKDKYRSFLVIRTLATPVVKLGEGLWFLYGMRSLPYGSDPEFAFQHDY